MVRRWFSYFQILSLDVVAGAVINSAVITHTFRVTVAHSTFLLLGLVVWIIYTADHLFDVRTINPAGDVSERHLFFLKYSQQITRVLFTAMALCLALLFVVSPKIILLGVILAILVGLYMIISHTNNALKGLFKEFTAAVLYASGIFIPVVVNAETISKVMVMVYLSLVVLAFKNLLVYAEFDKDIDRGAGFSSLALTLKSQVFRRVVFATSFFFISLSIYLFLLRPELPVILLQCVYLTIFLIHFAFWKWPERFMNRSVYRLIGDVSFSLPVVILLF